MCPNCGAEIKRFDLNQHCFECGIDLFYSQQAKLLSNDAKRCELEFASFRLLSEKLKTAFISGKPQILRLVFIVLSLGSLFVPFAKLNVSLPFFHNGLSFSGYGIIMAATNGNIKALFTCLESETMHHIALCGIIMLCSMALLLLTILAVFVFIILTVVNMQRFSRFARVASVIGMALSVISAIIAVVFAFSDGAFAAGAIKTVFSVGALASFASFTGMFIANHIIVKRNITPAFKDVDIQRIATLKKVKRGEITFDELPLPVFESEEEKEARLKLEHEESEREAKEALDAAKQFEEKAGETIG